MQMQKRMAPESKQTKRAREKLQKHWNSVEKKITPEALLKVSEEMHRWIGRHANLRVPLKAKRISLFDGNQNAAELSQRVKAIAKQLCIDIDCTK
jgi:hypothetical protein